MAANVIDDGTCANRARKVTEAAMEMLLLVDAVFVPSMPVRPCSRAAPAASKDVVKASPMGKRQVRSHVVHAMSWVWSLKSSKSLRENRNPPERFCGASRTQV